MYVFIFHIVVPNVHPAGCDNFLLAYSEQKGRKLLNSVNTTVNSGGETVISILSVDTHNPRIECTCTQNESQNTMWLYNDGTKLPPRDGNAPPQIHHRQGGILLYIPKGTPSLNYVGIYRCASMNDSIRVILKGDN